MTMVKYDRCPRLLNEQRTPGRIGSPDGPSYVAQFQCVQDRDHAGEHQFLPWLCKRVKG